MTGVEFHLSHEGAAQILKSAPVRAAVEAAAAKVADHVRAQGIKVGAFKGGHGPIELPVDTRASTSDRARDTVTIAHPAGLAVQAKHGALTKAASAAGLQVHSR